MPNRDNTYARIAQPFGDGYYDFAFGWDEAVEWAEKYPGRSLFHAFNAMHRNRVYPLGDVKEIIGLALIGGGVNRRQRARTNTLNLNDN